MTPGGCRTSNTSGPSGDPLHETTQMVEARRRPCKPPCLQHYVVLLLSGRLLSCKASSWWKRPAPPKKARIGKPLLKEYNQSKSTMTALIRCCHRANPQTLRRKKGTKGDRGEIFRWEGERLRSAVTPAPRRPDFGYSGQRLPIRQVHWHVSETSQKRLLAALR